MKTVIGGILLAVGLLVAGASGLCSGVMLISIMSSGSPGEAMSIIPLMLIVGGVPFLIGLGLFFGGRALIRSDREGER